MDSKGEMISFRQFSLHICKVTFFYLLWNIQNEKSVQILHLLIFHTKKKNSKNFTRTENTRIFVKCQHDYNWK